MEDKGFQNVVKGGVNGNALHDARAIADLHLKKSFLLASSSS
jgi:hypothetical protein